MRLVLFLTAACLCLTSCGERERANPLDPLNESTHGSPPAFEVVALDGSVELRWSPLKLDGLVGYNAYRSRDPHGFLELMSGSPYPSGLGSIIDSLLSNGTTYFYKLVPVIESYGEGTASPLLPATPGPHFAVVADAMSGTVTEFSADLRASIWTAGGFYYPFAVTSEGRSLWVTDLYGSVICLAADGRELWSNTDFILPLAISVRPDGTSAIADFSNGTVTVLSSGGGVESVISQSLNTPASVSFGKNGEIWVADPGSGLVNKYSLDGNLLRTFDNCTAPRFLDVEEAAGACWVIDQATNEIIKLSIDAEELFRVSSFSRLSALGVDNKNGGCWVSDSSKEEIVKISDDGRVLLRAGKVGWVASIRVSPDDGSVWLADARGARILVLSPDGRIITFASLPSSPTSITLVGGPI